MIIIKPQWLNYILELRDHPFFRRRILAKKLCTQMLWAYPKKNCQIFHQKNFHKVLIKIEEMADVFLNSANFAKHTFSYFPQLSGYTLDLKALIKVSKTSWTSQLSYEILKDRICILFFCHSHSHSALCNVHPVALDRNRR